MNAREKSLAFWIPLATLALPLLFLLIALVGIQANIDLFFGVYIASTILFIVVGLGVFALPSIPLFIRFKQKQNKTLTPERNRLWIALSVIVLILALVHVFFTYIGPLVIDWPPCPIPDGICWAGIVIPYWLHSLGFFGFGFLSVFALPYLWFVIAPLISKKRRQ